MNWLLFILRMLLSVLRIDFPSAGVVRARLDGRTQGGLFQDSAFPTWEAVDDRAVVRRESVRLARLVPFFDCIKAGFSFLKRCWWILLTCFGKPR